MPSGPNRRIFVLGGLGAAGAAMLPGAGATAAARGQRGAGIQAIRYPFELGVASGDPTPDGFVLWTRLAPAPLNTDGHGGMPTTDMAVEWQVATDQAFASIVASGTVTARYAEAHSVHVE